MDLCLASTIAIVALLSLGFGFLVDDHVFSILAFSMLKLFFAFLILRNPRKYLWVIQGHSDGMMLAILAIHFINVNYALPAMTPYKFKGSVGTAACIIIIPLVDTLRIVILRLSKKQSPFAPDKSHIHHAILRLGMTHSQTTLILAGVQLLFITLAIIFNQFSDVYIVSGLLVLSLLLSVTLDRLIISRLD
jgi:hypothetical protein